MIVRLLNSNSKDLKDQADKQNKTFFVILKNFGMFDPSFVLSKSQKCIYYYINRNFEIKKKISFMLHLICCPYKQINGFDVLGIKAVFFRNLKKLSDGGLLDSCSTPDCYAGCH